MKTLLLLVVMLFVWSLPASVQAGSNQVDLDGKGQSQVKQRGADPLKEGRKAHDSLSAQQGKKALANVKKQQAKNQADMDKAMKNMNKIKMPKATKPDF